MRQDQIARGNPELRWSYVVFLQKLACYIDLKMGLGECDATYGYARASLLHYARSMAENEYRYLEKPNLEYATETWAAQDIRKSDVFYYAALHARTPERERFVERARFFFQSPMSSLPVETRTRTHPLVILLTNGAVHSYFERRPSDVASPAADPAVEFPSRRRFVSKNKSRFTERRCYHCHSCSRWSPRFA